MPQPPVITSFPFVGSGLQASSRCKAWHERDRCCNGSIAELVAAVDKLTLRQDVLIDLIDQHYGKLAENMKDSLKEPLGREMLCIRSPKSLPQPPSERASTKGKSASVPTIMQSEAASVSGVHRNTSVGQLSNKTWWHRRQDSTEVNFSGLILPESEELIWATIAKRAVQTRAFEVISGAMIVLNMVSLFMNLHWHSCELAFLVGHSADDCGWAKVKFAFEFAEHLFNVWYVVELGLRVYAFRWAFFLDRLNVGDVVVVCIASVQYMFQQVHVPGIASMRCFRILRALRVVRIIRLLDSFRELHIVLKTLAASFYSLQWSMCVVGAIVWSSGLLVMQMLHPYIQDPEQSLEIREAMYLHYGSPLRAVFSMFVATFSTQWVSMAYEMIDHVDPYFGCFWVVFIVVVNFAVIRVISALFLKQTMDVASDDAERRAMESQKQKEKFARVLLDIFTEADTSGDGYISRDEFGIMVQSKKVLHAFELLGLEYEDLCALFDVMSSDDGYADYDEFLTGALQMKSSARTFDALRIMHELGSLSKSVQLLQKRLDIEVLKAPDFGEWKLSSSAA